MSDRIEERFSLDADGLADRLEGLLQEIRPAARGSALELYHRASVRSRLSRRTEGDAITFQRGSDAGTALRTWSKDAGIGFAACSGADVGSLRSAVELALGSAGPPEPGPAPWRHDAGSGRIDRDDGPSPAREALADWFNRARQELTELAPLLGGPVRPAEFWVEAATTVETWVATGGLRASRRRRRAWAMLRLHGSEADGRLVRPVLIGSRRWDTLPVDGWSTILEDRWVAGKPESTLPTRPLPVLFNPESSAFLLLALVRSLNGPDHDPQAGVGPGWDLVDDPKDPDALFGGSFDDAGFATRRARLADGRRFGGRIEGKGHYRRASFRDRPLPLASCPVVRTRGGDPPARSVLATGLNIHPLEPDRWVLEVEGALLHGGRPQGRVGRAFITVDPRQLVRRCIGAVGPSRAFHIGVRTPALVFDALTLER